MDWQQWIVGMVGGAVVLYLLRRLWCMVKGGKGSKCHACTADCPLKKNQKTV